MKGQGSSIIPARTRALAFAIGSRIPTPLLNSLAGSDRLAQLHGGKLWAWEANLLKVAKNVGVAEKAAGVGKLGQVTSGVTAATRTAGLWRATGVAGGVFATGAGAWELYQKGNVATAFRKDKAGYIADASGVAFNASLTAAMIAPNPVTIGATVVTGAVYGVSSIVDNWNKVKQFPGKVADAGRWTGRQAEKGFNKAVGGAKRLGKALNPFG